MRTGLGYVRLFRAPERDHGYVTVRVLDAEDRAHKIVGPCSEAQLGSLNAHWLSDEAFDADEALPVVTGLQGIWQVS